MVDRKNDADKLGNEPNAESKYGQVQHSCIYNITGLLCLDQFYSSGFDSSILKQHTNYLQMPLQPCSNFSLLDQREVQKVQGQLDAEKRETSSACKRVEHQI